MLAFQSGISEIDQKIDSIYHQKRKGLSKELINAGIIESKTKEAKENYKKPAEEKWEKLEKTLKSL